MPEAPKRKKARLVRARRRLPAAERRELLLAAARNVFGRQGLAATTLKDIGAEAGVDPAMVYRHFSSKDAIFDAAVAEPLEEAVAEWTHLASGSLTYSDEGEIAREFLGDKVGHLVRVMSKLTPLIGTMMASDRGADFYAQHVGPAIATFVNAIEAAKPHWKHSEYDSRSVAFAILGASMIAGMETAYGAGKIDFAELGHKLHNLVLDGIRLRR
jgi:TetR/AcrR family transcriptional regulator